ncbi:hypothetical protein SRRS_37000 [Sporomusa rhizae]|uniref:hypothetical protein n=1 Tax=Sporomusa rhizae TaxID=357999 RepID=UPI00352A26E0
MNVPKVSYFAQNQASNLQTDSSLSKQDDSSDSAGFKYVSIREGNIVCTYIVIGKNMKVLIGKSAVDEDKEDKKDGKTTDDKNGADKSTKTTEDKQAALNKKKLEEASFLTDSRMLGLTAYYQKKLREMMRNMESNIGVNNNETERTVVKPHFPQKEQL